MESLHGSLVGISLLTSGHQLCELKPYPFCEFQKSMMWADTKLHFSVLPFDYVLYHLREYNHL